MASSSPVRARSEAWAFRSRGQSLRRHRGARSRAGMAPKSGRPSPSHSRSASPSSRDISSEGATGGRARAPNGANRRRANEERAAMDDVVRPVEWPMTRENGHGSYPRSADLVRGLPVSSALRDSAESVTTPATTAASTASSPPFSVAICTSADATAPSAKSATSIHHAGTRSVLRAVLRARPRPRSVSPTRRPRPPAFTRAVSRAFASSRARTRSVAGLGRTVMTAGAARNAVRRTMNGDGSEAVGVGV